MAAAELKAPAKKDDPAPAETAASKAGRTAGLTGLVDTRPVAGAKVGLGL